MTDTQKQIEDIYAAQLKKQQSQLKQNYDTALSDLDAEKKALAEQTQANIDRARLDSQRAAVNNAEYYAAAGLTSGAKAQADLAQANQLQANMTALRAQQQEADEQARQQRALLGQQYSAAIRQAQEDNDLALAEALYNQAKKEEGGTGTELTPQEQAQAEAIKWIQQKYADGLVTDIGDWEMLVKIFGGTSADAVNQLMRKGYRYGSRVPDGIGSGGGGGYKYRDDILANAGA